MKMWTSVIYTDGQAQWMRWFWRVLLAYVQMMSNEIYCCCRLEKENLSGGTGDV
jgi:hypothetical protein